MSSGKIIHSCIYRGEVSHQRFTPRKHRFSYRIFFLAIDLDELPLLNKQSRSFKTDRFAPLRFFAQDYLEKKNTVTKNDVWNKVTELGGENREGRVLFVGQVRCFGLYFSPINCYYCYDQQEELTYLLAEVSNTPWNERHYYLIGLDSDLQCDKTFHVSPFMDMQMKYHWRIKNPGKHLSLSIENRAQDCTQSKLFRASIAMTKQPFSNKNLVKNLLAIPMMSVKTILGIYWQALKLYLKGVPFIGYSKEEKRDAS